MENEENVNPTLTRAQLEEAIGITHVKYDRLCELLTAASEKSSRFLSSMTNNTETWNQAIKSFDSQLSQKGKDMLVAQVAEDTETVQQLSEEIKQINIQIDDLRQRIYSCAKVDINDLLLDDLNEIRTALLDVTDEIKANRPLIGNYVETLRQQANEINQQIEACLSLDYDNSHLTDQSQDSLTRFMCTMFGLSPHDKSGFLVRLQRAMGFFSHTFDTSTPASEQIREIYSQYKKGAL